jgi:hypothetical protein
MTRVLVKMEIECQVKLPAGHEHDGQACDDPAIEAALSGFPQHCDVFLWGKENEPAKLHYEAHEEDCEIEEDGRE